MDTLIDNDLHLRLDAPSGLPLSLVAYLMRAVGAAYPGTVLDTGGFDRVVSMRIPHADYVAPRDVGDQSLAELAPGPDDPDLLMFTNGIRNGALGVSPPAWLKTLLYAASQQILDATDAPNYLSMEMLNVDGSSVCTWIVCRPGRPSPHDLRIAALARVDQLEQQLRTAGLEPIGDTPATNQESAR